MDRQEFYDTEYRPAKRRQLIDSLFIFAVVLAFMSPFVALAVVIGAR